MFPVINWHLPQLSSNVAQRLSVKQTSCYLVAASDANAEAVHRFGIAGAFAVCNCAAVRLANAWQVLEVSLGLPLLRSVSALSSVCGIVLPGAAVRDIPLINLTGINPHIQCLDGYEQYMNRLPSSRTAVKRHWNVTKHGTMRLTFRLTGTLRHSGSKSCNRSASVPAQTKNIYFRITP